MIPFDEAYALMLGSARILGSERVSLSDCIGRVLAEDIASDIDMPPFDKSAMDGFACRRADLPGPFKVVETVPAGRMPEHALSGGEAARIMTGAPLPPGADCVFMLEDSAEQDDGFVRFTGRNTSDNVCRRGEDIRSGDRVLKQGEWLGPAQVAVLATVGVVDVAVAVRPRLGIIATGSELVEAWQKPEGAVIRNSNGPQLLAQTGQCGALGRYYGIVPDTPANTLAAIRCAQTENDVIVLSGGVSSGDFDCVPQALADAGYRFLFDSVAMQPGRPSVFGSDGQTWCIGLPGNPVSTFIVFELMLKPFLYRLMGHDWRPLVVRARLSESLTRKKATRQSTLPVRFTDAQTVAPIEYHGSAHIGAMTRADGLVTLPVGCGEVKAGDGIDVRLL